MFYRGFNFFPFPFFMLFFGLIILALFLKGLALWKSARNSQKGWFIAILIINSLGILPIIYLLVFQKKNKKG